MQIKDVLIHLWLHKEMKENISNIGNEKWEELDLRILSTVWMSLAKNILVSVFGMLLAKELWEKFEKLYWKMVFQIDCDWRIIFIASVWIWK